MKILIIQQKMIGDVLTSSILFEALRLKYPNAQLDYLINEHTYAVVENNPFIDNYIFFTKACEKSKIELVSLAKDIRKRKYDVLIDVYSKLSSNLITLMSGAKVKISYFKPYTKLIYHHNIKRLQKTNDNAGLAIINRMQLLEPLQIDNKSLRPKIYLSDNEIGNAKLFLEKNNINLSKPLYMMSVLGSSVNKTYPLPFMGKIVDLVFKETKAQILFNYAPNQALMAKEVFDLCEENTKKHIFIDVFGKSLRDFLSITYHCDAVIGNEGGAINMAKALNVKTFAIFSPWIDKATWNIFESESHISVHLKDFYPELYTKSEKKHKNEYEQLYQKLEPQLFANKLKAFLK